MSVGGWLSDACRLSVIRSIDWLVGFVVCVCGLSWVWCGK